MGLSRTFVGFSSTDIHYYRLMLAWKENEHIDFNFANCQLGKEINSEDEAYIRRKCRERIDMAGTFAVLIGQDTRSKHHPFQGVVPAPAAVTFAPQRENCGCGKKSWRGLRAMRR